MQTLLWQMRQGFAWDHVADKAEEFPGLFSNWTGIRGDPDY